MVIALFKSPAELDVLIDEIGQRLDILYKTSTAASRAETWASLTTAVLKLAAPEDHEHVYQRLNALFSAHASRREAPPEQT
ncbi:hypothetical protein [Pseudoxanthomonas sp. Root630]|uniref:hypothetical protein n=1 Tax=Pseudoxanthomonas sp. Root630 TaxID=1736574 RepID=UPI00070360DA|nr:hypothetical protein [Pseudoxanthomonas sp. Root630]KRA47461.1 hypothetical protein ASD72_20290 [Pseudoxanthomonas sp. Root630]